jgi:acetyl esterase/lipase
VSASYHLSNREGTGARHPAHVEDVARAVARAAANAADDAGDPARPFAMGHSAGARLATASDYLRATGHAPGDLAGVFPTDCAPYDLP